MIIVSFWMFEPNPVNFEYLQNKLGDNSNVHLFNVAASNVNGTSTLLLRMGLYLGNQHGSMKNESGGAFRIPIQTVLLDEILSKLNHVHIMKTDTEGFDLIALRGAKRILAKTDLLIFECHDLQTESRGGPGTSDFEAQQEMSELGFELYHIHPKTLLRFDGNFYHWKYDARKQFQNCFAVKKDYIYKDDILSQYENICK